MRKSANLGGDHMDFVFYAVIFAAGFGACYVYNRYFNKSE